DTGAESTMRARTDVVRAERGALAAAEPGRLRLDAPPSVGLGRVGLEDALRSLDALERAVADGDRAPRAQHAGTRAAGDLLLERLPLAVGVEEARDGCVPPVDDRQPGQQPRRLAEQHVLLAAVLREAHVGEVRRAGIHRLGPARPAQVPEERGVAVPLLEERGPVVGPRLLAERRAYVLELLDDRRRGRRRRHRPLQARAHLPEERELLLHDAVRHAVVSGGKQSGYRVRRPRYSARCHGIDGRRGARHWLADAT